MNKTPEEQFAQDWMIIMENNDHDSYEELKEKAKNSENDYELASSLRDEWENLCEEIKDLVEKEISPLSGQLANQILNYWGVEPFMIIARDMRERVEEDRKHSISQSTKPKFDVLAEVTEGDNAFSIMSEVRRAILDAGATSEQVDQYLEDSRSGDYEHLLKVAGKWVNFK